MIIKTDLDKIGFVTSFLCAIHCALLPIFISLLSLNYLSFLTNPEIEYIIISFSLFIGLISLIPSYLRVHKQKYPLFVLFSGFLFIFLGHTYLESIESVITPVGAVLVALSHLLNWDLLKNNQCNTKNCNHLK